MEYRVRELLEKFLKAYMSERDLKKTLEFVSDEIISIGTGVQETARNKHELEQLLQKEFSVNLASIFYTIEDYWETSMHPEVCCAFCSVAVRVAEESGEYFTLQTRLTATCCREGGQWKFLNLHMSTPTSVQTEEEFFPLKYGHEVIKKLSVESHRELIKLMTNTFPGGIIGVYLEKGFPLHIINDEMLDYMGYTYEELRSNIGEMVIETIAPEDRERVEEKVFRDVREKGEYEVQYRLLKKNGEKRWVYDKGRKITTEEGRCAIIGVVIDISKSVERQEMLQKEAEQDSLTGILNRKAAVRLIKKSLQEKEDGVLFMMDIDNFKKLNDTYGHLAGDEVLVGFADILRRNSRSDDICARLGGDEFLVYFSGLKKKETAVERAEMIARQFQERNGNSYEDVEISVSIGIVMRSGEQDFDSLYEAADRALYQVKNQGKGGFMFAGESQDPE